MMTLNEVRDRLVVQYPDCYIDIEACCRYHGTVDKSKKTDFRICITSNDSLEAGDIFWKSGSSSLEALLQIAMSLKPADAPAVAVSE